LGTLNIEPLDSSSSAPTNCNCPVPHTNATGFANSLCSLERVRHCLLSHEATLLACPATRQPRTPTRYWRVCA